MIAILQKIPAEDRSRPLMILDGFNGGGNPREINLVTNRVVEESDAQDCGDCEDLVGQKVMVLGYGFY